MARRSPPPAASAPPSRGPAAASFHRDGPGDDPGNHPGVGPGPGFPEDAGPVSGGMPDDAASAADYGLVDRPSKTRRKQDSHDLQSLGEALAELSDTRLQAMPMPEILLDALREYRRTRTHEGRRRQMQYIGKLMRRADPEPLREAVAEIQLGSARETLALHKAEHWRTVLIADDEALGRWAREHPDDDLQRLRSLVRAARKDAAATPEQRNGRAYRDLFRHVRDRSTDAARGSDASSPDTGPRDHDD